MLKFVLCAVLLAKGIAIPVDQDAQVKAAASPLLHFTLNAVRHRDVKKNWIISPVSLEAAFGMLLKGAGEKTASEIRKILHFSNTTDSQIHSELHQLMLKEESKPKNEVAFKTANLALLSNEFQPRTDYVNFVKENYHGLVVSEDFANSGQKALDLANSFVEKQTLGRVKGHFQKAFSRNTKLAIVSTAFFNGAWVNPFAPTNTRKSAFYNLDKTVTQVDMMYTRSTFNSCRLSETDGVLVQVPLVGGSYLIMLLADDRYGYPEGITWLTETNMLNCIKRSKPAVYNLYLPKLKIEEELDVKDLAQKMGSKIMFDPQLANFKGISDTPGVYVSSFVNRATFEFSEGGTYGQASSNGVRATDGPAKDLRFDHTFGFGLMDKDRVLFSVIVSNL